jgi:hypothetical protein
MIEDVFRRYLLGQDPHRIERFWRRAHGSGFSFRPDPSMMGVVSALEMACWDIIGKAAGKPVHELLGGRVHERLRTYTYLYPRPDQDPATFYADPDLSAERAAECVALGFTAIKFDPAGAYTVFDARQPDLEAIERSALFCKRIREAVGSRADLLFGTHGQFTPSGAIRLAKRLEPYDPLWFEEPTPPTYHPADFNKDGTVNAPDLGMWRTAYRASATADANGDGAADGRDFLIWQRNLGATGAIAATGAVPEPASVVLIATAGIVGALRGRMTRRLGRSPT